MKREKSGIRNVRASHERQQIISLLVTGSSVWREVSRQSGSSQGATSAITTLCVEESLPLASLPQFPLLHKVGKSPLWDLPALATLELSEILKGEH